MTKVRDQAIEPGFETPLSVPPPGGTNVDGRRVLRLLSRPPLGPVDRRTVCSLRSAICGAQGSRPRDRPDPEASATELLGDGRDHPPTRLNRGEIDPLTGRVVTYADRPEHDRWDARFSEDGGVSPEGHAGDLDR